MHVMSGIPEQSSHDFSFSFNNLEEFYSSALSHSDHLDGVSPAHTQKYAQNFGSTSESGQDLSSTSSMPASSHQSTEPSYPEHDFNAHLSSSNDDLRAVSDLSEDILGLPLDMRIRFESDSRKYSNMDSSNLPAIGGSSMPNMGNASMLEQFGGMV